MSGTDQTRLQSPFRSLRHRNYRLYFFGQLVSLTGSWMQLPALMWLAYTLTAQSRWPAWLAAAQFLPTFLLGFWGGSLADRVPKRALLFWSQVCLMVLPLAYVQLVLADVRNPWLFLVVAATAGFVGAVDFPTRLSFVSDMVERADLTNAVALNALLFNAARLVGPVLGWLILSSAGPAWCFLANSVTFLALLLALTHMEMPARPKTRLGLPTDELVPAWDGFHYLAARPNLLALLFLAGLTGACGWPFLALLPALADRALGLPPTGYFVLLSGMGCGALAAAFTAAALGDPQRSKALIGIGVLLVVLGLLGLSVANGLGVALVSCVVLGFGLIVFFSTSQAVLQLAAGDHNRGQVMGIWAMVVSGAQPLGNFLAGPAADRWGEQRVLAFLGLGYALAALATALVLSGFGRRG